MCVKVIQSCSDLLSSFWGGGGKWKGIPYKAIFLKCNCLVKKRLCCFKYSDNMFYLCFSFNQEPSIHISDYTNRKIVALNLILLNEHRCRNVVWKVLLFYQYHSLWSKLHYKPIFFIYLFNKYLLSTRCCDKSCTCI